MELKIDLRNYTFIDLGLPSGTLWAGDNVPGLWTSKNAREKAVLERFSDII